MVNMVYTVRKNTVSSVGKSSSLSTPWYYTNEKSWNHTLSHNISILTVSDSIFI